MPDRETLAVYNAKAGDYADLVDRTKPGRHLSDFIDALPKGGHVLDLGCGPGKSAADMAEAGLTVDAWDASPEMAQIGHEAFELTIEVKGFEALVADQMYDGIFANFSLLHAPKAEMPDHLARIANALKPGGLFHIGMKTGTGEMRDRLGRFYAYYEDGELTGILENAGFTVTNRAFGSDIGLDGTEAPWIIMRATKDV